MLTIDEARTLLAMNADPLPAASVTLSDALGLRLADAVVADTDLPLVDLSAMDGYATRHEDLLGHTALPVSMEVPAGATPGRLETGSLARIFTGAPLPAGADTVVEQERAQVGGDGRVLLEGRPLGANIRHRGELFACGSLLAPAGAVLTPARIALLAAGGVLELKAIPRPRVASLVTGHELVGLDETPAPGQIRNTNGPMFRALAEEQGLVLTHETRVDDDKAALRQSIETAFDTADLVLSSGGVSVGDYDFVPEVIEELGGKILFHRIQLKPGKPTLVARRGGKWFIGLPGNPLAVLAVWRLFVQPLVHLLSGDDAAFDEVLPSAAITEAFVNKGKRSVLRPAIVSPSVGGAIVQVLPWKGSHDLVAAAPANALLRAEAGQAFARGEQAPCYLL